MRWEPVGLFKRIFPKRALSERPIARTADCPNGRLPERRALTGSFRSARQQPSQAEYHSSFVLLNHLNAKTIRIIFIFKHSTIRIKTRRRRLLCSSTRPRDPTVADSRPRRLGNVERIVQNARVVHASVRSNTQ